MTELRSQNVWIADVPGQSPGEPSAPSKMGAPHAADTLRCLGAPAGNWFLRLGPLPRRSTCVPGSCGKVVASFPRTCVRGLHDGGPLLWRSVQFIKAPSTLSLPVGLRIPDTTSQVAAAAAAAVTAAPPVVWAQWVMGIAAIVLSVSVSIFLFVALSTLKAVRLAATRLEIVLMILEKELPDTMAAMRLSSLEVSDCVEEITGLGSDLGAGLRASAKAVSAAERGLVKAAGVVTKNVVPVLKERAPMARESLEAGLRERASLEYTEPVVRQAARGTTERIRALRTVLAALDVGGRAVGMLKSYKGAQDGPHSVLKFGPEKTRNGSDDIGDSSKEKAGTENGGPVSS